MGSVAMAAMGSVAVTAKGADCNAIKNTKWFKRTLICFDTDTQYANFRGNPVCQATR